MPVTPLVMQAKYSISLQASLRMCSHCNGGAFSRRIARNAHQQHTSVAFVRIEPKTYKCGTYGSISYAKRLKATKYFDYACSGELGDVTEESGFNFE